MSNIVYTTTVLSALALILAIATKSSIKLFIYELGSNRGEMKDILYT